MYCKAILLQWMLMDNISKKRILVFDFIRLFAILMVVLCHTLEEGILPVDLGYDSLGILGNTLFFFISGYLIYLNNNSIKSKGDIFQFYKKRLLRIYPLYIFAIIVFVITSVFIGNVMLFGDIGNYSIIEVIANTLGLQCVLYPMFVDAGEVALWFIGMIVVYYLIYPIVIYFSHQNVIRYLIYSCIAIGVLAVLKIFTNLIIGGVFEYYFVFVAGVFFAWINIFKSKFLKPLSILSFIIFLICFIVAMTVNLNPLPESGNELISLDISSLVQLGVYYLHGILYGISGVFVLHTIFNWIKPNKVFENIIIKGAFSAYAVYLFHGQFFTIVNRLLLSNGTIIAEIFSNPLVYDIVLFVILIPIIFIIAYFLQKGENICVNKLRGR